MTFRQQAKLLGQEKPSPLFDRYPACGTGRSRRSLVKSGEWKWLRSGHGLRLVNHQKGQPVRLPFTFVDTVNRAPIILRRKAIQELGGIDNTFAPYQCDDVDLCLRAWKAGLQVGLYSTEFVRDVGMGGMRIFNAETNYPSRPKRTESFTNGTETMLSGFASVVTDARRSERV